MKASQLGGFPDDFKIDVSLSCNQSMWYVLAYFKELLQDKETARKLGLELNLGNLNIQHQWPKSWFLRLGRSLPSEDAVNTVGRKTKTLLHRLR